MTKTKSIKTALIQRKRALLSFEASQLEAKMIMDEAHRALIKANAPLGAAMRSMRQFKKINLITMSKKTGLSQGNLSRMENGQMNITERSLTKILEALGI